MSGTKLSPGDIAPSFTLPDANETPTDLASYRGQNVIVYFYPAAMTRGCTTEACDFRDSLASWQGSGYAVLGISPDSPAKLAQFRDHEALTFPLLSDENLAVTKAYGAYGDRTLYGKTVTGVIRSTFVIDPDGRIAKAMYNVRATGHVAKLRRDLGLDG